MPHQGKLHESIFNARNDETDGEIVWIGVDIDLASLSMALYCRHNLL